MPSTPFASDILPDPQSKARFVQEGFNRIAATYDLLNDLISFGLHRRWKRSVLTKGELRSGESVLDICTGTGDLAYLAAVHHNPPGRVVALDFAESMLRMAAGRTGWPCRNPAVQPYWMRGDAMQLPFPDASFDLVTVGYGLRNVTHLEAALNEVFRVLRQGGRFVSLDTCEPALPILRLGYRFHCFIVIPFLGSIISGDNSMYRYLPASAQVFSKPEELSGQLQRLGFADTQVWRKLGGAAAIVFGRKPGLDS